MKRKILSLVLSIFVAATVFTGCAESVDNNSNKESYTNDVLELKLALYSKVLGTWENYDNGNSAIITNKADVVIFANDSISLDDKKYDFNPLTDIYFEEEMPEEWRLNGETFYFYIRDNDKYYSVILDDANPKDWIKEGKLGITFSVIEENGSWNAFTFDFTKVSSGDIDNPGTDLDFSVEGDWSYTVTGGAKTNLTLNNDNTFSFVNKLNNYKVSGNYALSGNTITFDYSKDSQSVNESFTITGSEDSITLTYKGDSSVSLMFVGFYGSIDKSITLSK